jgi:hypothetical protein
MRHARTGLMLSATRLLIMGLPHRIAARSRAPGFFPGVRNVLRYETRRLWHWIYERERLGYHVGGLSALLRRMGFGR